MFPIHFHDSDCSNSSNDDVSAESIVISRIFGSCMSILSMFGALLIIFSYIAIKDIRTNARFILLHLSVGDFGVGCVNFLGASIYFEQYINTACCSSNQSSTLPLSCETYTDMCKTQAFFASFFTIASILWTLVLAIYVYVLVVDTNRSLSNTLMRFSYFVCWGLPFVISLWFVLTDRLGSTKIGSGGWCSLRVRASDKDGNISIFTVLFGSDLWVMTTFFVIVILYPTTHCFLRFKINEMKRLYTISKEQLGQFASDHKFLLIPLFFIILRIGSVVFSVLYVYTHLWHKMSHTWRDIVFYATAIGDSSQGLVNGFIFCFLTPRVRKKLCFWPFCCKKNSNKFTNTAPLTETSEQKKLLDNVDVSYSNNYTSSADNLSSDDSYED